MKTTILLLVTLFTFLLGSSFTAPPIPSFVGTYGVSKSDPSHIQLTIHADHTFLYQDFSVPTNKIRVEGQWSERRGKIVLAASAKVSTFHAIWSFDEKGQIAKSRRGLSFYRLQRIAE